MEFSLLLTYSALNIKNPFKISNVLGPFFLFVDDGIIEKLRDEEDVRVRLTGADELNRAVKSMKDLSPLLPQMRLFLTFLDSLLEGESNFKMVLLVLETYGVLIDRMRHKIKPHLRSICSALLRHASNTKIVVRIENYRVIKKLMLCAKPNIVLNHMFDHLGDKRSVVREDVLNIVMYALLTFPSNEFDLKVRLLPILAIFAFNTIKSW